MQLQHWLAVTLALTPSLASAALFPSNTLVKQIDAKGFKAAMKENVRLLSTHPSPISNLFPLSFNDYAHHTCMHARITACMRALLPWKQGAAAQIPP